LEAWDEEELAREVLTHLWREHPLIEQQEEAQVRERVAAHSYRYECLEEVYAGHAEPDEEFGLDPY
jgi:SOS response regulatory protein OraA/RecX